MAKPLIAGLPPGLELVGGFFVRIAALDSATGAAVAGVNVSNVVITAADVSGQGGTVAVSAGPIEWLHLEYNSFAPEEA